MSGNRPPALPRREKPSFARQAILLSTLLSCGPAVAGEERPVVTAGPDTASTDAFLAEWGRRMEGTRSLRLRFRQEKKLRILRKPRVSEGDLAYEEGKLSVMIRGRDGEIESEVRFRDGRLTLHYPRLRRAEVIDVGAGGAGPGAGAPFLPVFGADPGNMKKDHEVALVRRPAEAGAKEAGGTLDVLILTPRDPKSPVRRIEMTFRDFEMREYLQVDTNGDEARMTITSAERNVPVPPERFTAELPAGTKVVPLDGQARPER